MITSEVLEHVPDDTGALAELVRVLRPGGAFAATVPSWLPEKVNWMLSDDYHAPAAVGGHVRIYSATELKAKLRAAGLRLAGSHHAHALHSPYWWLKCAVGVNDDDHPIVTRYRRFLEWDIIRRPRSTRIADRLLSPVLGKSLVLYGTRRDDDAVAAPAPRRRRGGMTAATLPRPAGVLSAAEVRTSAEHLASLQLRVRDDPVVPRRPLRPVEPRRVGDGARRRRAPLQCRRRLPVAGRDPASGRQLAQLLPCRRRRRGEQARHQRVRLRRHRRLAPLVLHARPRFRRAAVADGRPRARLGAVVAPPRRAGAVGGRGRRLAPVGLRPAHRHVEHPARAQVWPSPRRVVGAHRPHWRRAATRMADIVATTPDAFAPKERWAMDWYYPVLTGALDRRGRQGPARRRLGERSRWRVSACAASATSRGSPRRRRPSARSPTPPSATSRRRADLLRWTRAHRREDGSYWTGIVYAPGASPVQFPFEEHTSYTAAAVILAADAIAGASPASDLFTPRPIA